MLSLFNKRCTCHDFSWFNSNWKYKVCCRANRLCVHDMNLFSHQLRGIDFLQDREGAGLFWEMGVGKTRTALQAARKFYDARGKQKIDRVLVLCPASVRFAWMEELRKLSAESSSFDVNVIAY